MVLQSIREMSAQAVTVNGIVGHAALDAPRNSTGNGADLGAFSRAFLASHDGSDSGSARSTAHCATNGAAT